MFHTGLTMASPSLWSRVHGKYQRAVSQVFFRRPFHLPARAAYISFTFDDFPISALTAGGDILKRHGVRGTYYAAFGLMGQDTPSGRIFQREDLPRLLADGHELGCHTYAHCHSWDTPPGVFEDSVLENRRVLAQLAPGVTFKSFSYPICVPRPFTKRRTERHFESCRGGGQTFNSGETDLANLRAFFLEKSRENPAAVKELIDRNQQARGWLVLATHDVSAQPTPYGCVPEFFDEIVRYAAQSGARILPVGEALAQLRLGK